MAKDKYHNAYMSSKNARGGGGGVVGVGGNSNIVDGVVGVSIANTDKDMSATKTSLRLNGVRGPYASSVEAISPPLGGINITKEQFQQQLALNRSKRYVILICNE